MPPYTLFFLVVAAPLVAAKLDGKAGGPTNAMAQNVGKVLVTKNLNMGQGPQTICAHCTLGSVYVLADGECKPEHLLITRTQHKVKGLHMHGAQTCPNIEEFEKSQVGIEQVLLGIDVNNNMDDDTQTKVWKVCEEVKKINGAKEDGEEDADMVDEEDGEEDADMVDEDDTKVSPFMGSLTKKLITDVNKVQKMQEAHANIDDEAEVGAESLAGKMHNALTKKVQPQPKPKDSSSSSLVQPASDQGVPTNGITDQAKDSVKNARGAMNLKVHEPKPFIASALGEKENCATEGSEGQESVGA